MVLGLALGAQATWTVHQMQYVSTDCSGTPTACITTTINGPCTELPGDRGWDKTTSTSATCADGAVMVNLGPANEESTCQAASCPDGATCGGYAVGGGCQLGGAGQSFNSYMTACAAADTCNGGGGPPDSGSAGSGSADVASVMVVLVAAVAGKMF